MNPRTIVLHASRLSAAQLEQVCAALELLKDGVKIEDVLKTLPKTPRPGRPPADWGRVVDHQRIKNLMGEQEITAYEFSRLLGKSPWYVKRMFASGGPKTEKVLDRWATALGVSVEAITVPSKPQEPQEEIPW